MKLFALSVYEYLIAGAGNHRKLSDGAAHQHREPHQGNKRTCSQNLDPLSWL